MGASAEGFVVGPDEGQRGNPHRTCKLHRGQTGHAALLETVVRPGILATPHTHEREDEIWYVVSGVTMVMLGDDLHEVGEGSTIWRPRGLQHASWVPPDAGPAKVISIIQPGGWEQQIIEFDRIKANGEPLSEEEFVRISATHGVHFDYDKGREIAQKFGLKLY